MREEPRARGTARDEVTVDRVGNGESGLRAVIALDSPSLGPAVGGCRMQPYPHEAAAVEEGRALARATSREELVAGLPFAGGKAVIRGDPRKDESPALWAAFARALERLGGRYWTGEDIGTTPADMDAIVRGTRYVLGRSAGAGDLGPMTALGVLRGLRVALRHRFGTDRLEGVRVAVQGLGAVDMPLATLLAEAGARLVVSDPDPAKVANAVDRLGAPPVPPEAILEVEAEVLAPSALGGVVGPAEVGRLGCAVVAGAADNPLATPDTAALLHRRAILYAPDYVINAMGVIAAAAELDPGGYDPDRVRARLSVIDRRLGAIPRGRSARPATARRGRGRGGAAAERAARRRDRPPRRRPRPLAACRRGC